MKIPVCTLISLFILAILSSCSSVTQEPAPPIYSTTPMAQTDFWSDWWQQRHLAKLEEAKSRPVDIVMIGDSITHRWELKGQTVWNEFYSHRNALNLGFGGDRTEHVLWRLRQGEVDSITPKVAVLMIGTNNTGQRMDPADHTVKGIEAIVLELRRRLPNTRILLLAIFPRDHSPHNEMRRRNNKVNARIAHLADEQDIFFLDLSRHFIEPDGTLKSDLFPDQLHLNQAGYRVWAQAMEPFLKQALEDAMGQSKSTKQ